MLHKADNLVEVRDMSFSRGDRRIFEDINLTVPRGKVTAIMGPSGIGKTTLLRLIGGQLTPDSGEIWFDGDNIPALSRRQLYDARKKMSMLFQSGALFTDLTVFENVAYPLREHSNLPEPLLRSTVLMKLEAVGLRGAAQLMPNELSGGMARRAALARAIALDPEMIMFDEPFVGQDPITMGVLVKLIDHVIKSVSVLGAQWHQHQRQLRPRRVDAVQRVDWPAGTRQAVAAVVETALQRGRAVAADHHGLRAIHRHGAGPAGLYRAHHLQR